jgi:glutaconyl-CoA/methylmalonyl-CoA decarboxylase subunit gamma
MKMFRVVINDNEYKVGIEELQEDGSVVTKSAPSKPAPKASAPRPSAAPKAPAPSAPAGSGTISAAMPGTILDIRVNVGEKVSAGQVVMILEAMKMENEIMAAVDGEVKEIQAVKGSSVNAGDVLCVIS